MPLGLVGEDIVVLNEHSLWSGGPFESPVSNDILASAIDFALYSLIDFATGLHWCQPAGSSLHCPAGH